MADGSVIIDTELDSSGLKTGLAKLGGVAAAGVTTAVAAISGLGIAAINVGSEFESAFAGVKKTVDATDEQLASLRTEILKMAKGMPIAATEIASIAEAAGQLGIKTENISDFTKTMADLGVATNMTCLLYTSRVKRQTTPDDCIFLIRPQRYSLSKEKNEPIFLMKNG